MIDLRSDTVTRPTPGMRAAMAARRGRRRRLRRRSRPSTACRSASPSLLGKEAALFVPSGTMSNQIAVKRPHRSRATSCSATPTATSTTTRPAAPARAVAASPAAPSTATTASSTSAQLEDKIRPDQRPPRAHPAGLPGEHAQPRRRQDLSAGEDRGHQPLGPQARPDRCTSTAPVSGTPSSPPASRRRNGREHFDTVSVCFSKGLGAPVGSAVASML